MNADRLLAHYETIAEAPDAISRLRQFILDLAVRGKLVPQERTPESALALLHRIENHKAESARFARAKETDGISQRGCNKATFAIPSTWTWTSLGNITISRDGDRVPVNRADRENRAKIYDYYGASGVIDKIDGYLFDRPLLLIGEDGANLLNRSTPIAFIARGKYWVNNHAHVLDGISETLLRYLELFINAMDLAPYVTGTAQPKMNQAKMNSIPIALPPLEEQLRIVEKINELMALCDRLEATRNQREKTRERLTTASFARLKSPEPGTYQRDVRFVLESLTSLTARLDQLVVFRDAILSLAVHGNLVLSKPAVASTSEARQGVQLAHPFHIPDSWKWTTVQATLDSSREISYGVIKLGVEPQRGGVPTLRCSDVRPGFIDLSNVRKVHESIEAEYVRTRLVGGEVLISIRGTLGGVARVPDELKGFNVAREVAVIPVGREVDAQFMVYLMLSPYFWDHIQKNLRGIAYKGLNLGLLREIPIPLPQIAEQRRIVAKIDQLMAVCDQLARNLTGADETRSRLLHSLLAEALQGSSDAIAA
jgi:type I restriction enzyme S subunit